MRINIDAKWLSYVISELKSNFVPFVSRWNEIDGNIRRKVNKSSMVRAVGYLKRMERRVGADMSHGCLPT